MKQMNKKAFVDPEVLYHPGFVILAVLAISATVLGWTMGPKLGFEDKFPVWQLLIMLLGEIVACYIITLRSV